MPSEIEDEVAHAESILQAAICAQEFHESSNLQLDRGHISGADASLQLDNGHLPRADACPRADVSLQPDHGHLPRADACDHAPAMLVVFKPSSQPHRWRNPKRLRVPPLPLAVSRPVTKKEWESKPDGDAAKSVKKEWKKLWDQRVWDPDSVQCWYKIAADARKSGKKVHMGALFALCVEKGYLLPSGSPGRRHKGRVVFQGNRVFDEFRDSALFQDLGSAPSTMDAARACDLYGCVEGCSEEIADAEGAYTQSPFDDECTETWVLLPESEWPDEWHEAVRTGKMKRPVVKLLKALYGHPDAGSMWERYCHRHLVAQGYISLKDEGWPGCYYHPSLALFLTVYVDDFKLAGPRQNLAQGWKLIRQDSATTTGLKIEDPTSINGQVYLGCRHFKEETTLPNGKKIRLMTYDMSEFFSSCVDKYLELAGSKGQKTPLSKAVNTPFLPEDMKESNQGKPNAVGPVFECSWCKATYPLDEIKEAPVQTGRKKVVSTSETDGIATFSKSATTVGVLSSIAAQVLMKLLYGARFCRQDLLRAICSLARRVTTWDELCDKRLHRLVSYVSNTLDHRLFAWCGDKLADLEPYLFADADLAGCPESAKSTCGIFHAVRGPNTFFPISAISKRHSNVSSSTPEAEITSGSMALRLIGLASLDLWDILLNLEIKGQPKRKQKVVMHFMDDNQAFIAVCHSGRNPTMRHLHRHHRISIALLHEVFKRLDWQLHYARTDEMAADIFTKMFDNYHSWRHACQLIGIVPKEALTELLADTSCKAKTAEEDPEHDNNQPAEVAVASRSASPDRVPDATRFDKTRVDKFSLPSLSDPGEQHIPAHKQKFVSHLLNVLSSHIGRGFAKLRLGTPDSLATYQNLDRADSSITSAGIKTLSRLMRQLHAFTQGTTSREMVASIHHYSCLPKFPGEFLCVLLGKRCLMEDNHQITAVTGITAMNSLSTDWEYVIAFIKPERKVFNINSNICNSLRERCLSLQIPLSDSRQNVLPVGETHIRSLALGYYSQGPFNGITRAATTHAETVKSLTGFIRRYVPDFQFNALIVNQDYGGRPHVDRSNLGMSYILGVGNYSGGELWIHNDHGRETVELSQRITGYVPGTYTGKLLDLKHKLTEFNGRLLHSVQPHEGERITIVWYFIPFASTTTNICMKRLHEFGFNFTNGNGANHIFSSKFSTTPVVLDKLDYQKLISETFDKWSSELESGNYNRVIVEICSGPNSLMGSCTSVAADGCLTCRITESLDFTAGGLDLALKIIKLATVFLGKSKVLLWVSMPCTGGSSWQWVNRYIARSRKKPEMTAKLDTHLELKAKLSLSLGKLLEQTDYCKPAIALEWPLRCTYWQDADIIDLQQRYSLRPYRVDGCMLGLVVRFQPGLLGKPLQKPWMVKTNLSLLGQHLLIICDGSHAHGKCSGKDAKYSEHYTPVFAERVHTGFGQAVANGHSPQ